jgi:hypothetical protein
MSSKVFRLPLTVACLTTLFAVALPLSTPVLAGSAEGLPGRRVGGGSRGCRNATQTSFVNPKQLMALVPTTNVNITATATPTLFFHIPALPTARTIEFVLQDDRNHSLYETSFVAPVNQSGVIPVSLPTSAPALELGKHYRWYFSVICNPEDRAQDIGVDGWLKRVRLPQQLEQQLRTIAPAKQAGLYASSGLWQEAVATLASLRRDRPQDASLITGWATLLRSAGLDAIVQSPILEQQHSANAKGL